MLKLVNDGPQEAIQGTAVRVKPDGSKERVPLIDLKIGDMFVNEDSGQRMQVAVCKMDLQEINTGRFQFLDRNDPNWYEAANLRGLTIHFLCDPPTSPYGRRGAQQEVVWETTTVLALTIVPVAEETA